MNYQINDIILGEISGIQPYGAFVKLDNGEIGLIHISEISSFFVKDIHDFVKVGQKIKLKVIDIIKEKHMYRLSLKQVEQRNRQNVRNMNYSQPKKRFKVPLDQQDFTPLEENLNLWINNELKKMEEN